MRRPGIFLFIFFIMVASATAVQTIQLNSPDRGINIVYPKNEYIKEGSLVELNFHIFNSTTKLLKNDTTDCIIHIYNSTGTKGHIIMSKLAMQNNSDFYFNFNTTGLSRGVYPYNIICNNSVEGGYESSTLLINKDGRNPDAVGSTNLLAWIIGIGVIVGLLLYFAFNLKSEEHAFLTFLLSGLGLLILLLIPAGLMQIVDFDLGRTFFIAYEWILGIFSTYLFLYYLVYKPMVNNGWINIVKPK